MIYAGSSSARISFFTSFQHFTIRGIFISSSIKCFKVEGRSAPVEFSFHNFESLIFNAVTPVHWWPCLKSMLQVYKQKSFGFEDVEFKVYSALNTICQSAIIKDSSASCRHHKNKFLVGVVTIGEIIIAVDLTRIIHGIHK